MTALRVLLARLRGLFARRRMERELRDEIESHLALRVDENLGRGMDPDAARREALVAFGGVEQTREAYRDAGGLPWLETLAADLRYGVRVLAKSPGFAATAALSIAIGIGANTAIFSVINAVLLRSLPVARPFELIALSVAGSQADDSFSYPHYERLRDGVAAVRSLAASGGTHRMRMIVGAAPGAAGPETVQAERVSGNLFAALGVDAALGRTLTDTDDRAGAPPVAVISDGLWRRRFGGDPGIVGRSLTLDDVPFTIVGVAPRGFFGFEVGASPELWWPLHQLPRVSRGAVVEAAGWTWLRLLGRLTPGKSFADVQAEATVVFDRILADTAALEGAGWTAAQRRRFFDQRLVVETGAAGWTRLRRPLRAPLFVLMAIVGLVLGIACANVASLLLARASARRKEISMRLAIGASRGRVVRQLLTESLVLALLGGGLGVLGALFGLRLLLAYLQQLAGGVAPQRVLALDLAPDGRVLAFTLGLSLSTGVLFGLVPALRATRLDLLSALKQATGLGRSGSVLHRMLVVSQVALSLFLLVGTGLLVRTLQNLRGVDAGYASERLLLVSVDVGSGYEGAARTALYQQLIARLGTLPGVKSASLSQWGLLSPNYWGNKILVDGYAAQPDEDLRCYGQIVGPRFFETFGIPLRLGREFSERDMADAPRVAVINETMARSYFGEQDPIGRRFRFSGRPDVPIEIVGVARDAKYRSLRERPTRTFYVPFLQQPTNAGASLALATEGSLGSAVPAIRQALQGVDPRLQLLDVKTMAEIVDTSLVLERFASQLASFFSGVALLLTALGLYGLMSYGVAGRTAEIGVRVALGARRRDIAWLVLREALGLAVVGSALGLPAGLLGARAISSLLFGLGPSDPTTLALAGATVLLVAALAGFLPARRAARVDPLTALRYD